MPPLAPFLGAIQPGETVAFDSSLTAFALAGDLTSISNEYLFVSLLAAAVACIAKQQAEWWNFEVMPDEAVYREVAQFFDDNGNETPEASANFLLLVRVALMAERQ